jgi:aromatic ring-opening dioxygenase catalytic subunit (LigB family)
MDPMALRPRSSNSPVLYFPHGGGPLPLLGDRGHRNMVDFLQRIAPTFDEPSAILVISAHWEEEKATITGGASPSLIYDYYGFPEESYEIKYPAPGDPSLAKKISGLLKESGMEAQMDDQRGFDHGLFVPLKIMYPDAHIPSVQLSLLTGLDPESHIRLGRALSALRKQNVLIIGSGFSFHNLRAFSFSGRHVPDPNNEAFQQWLIDTCTREDISREEREKRLVGWERAPFARYCHPREEHLMPLHVCCGLAGTAAKLVFDGEVLGKRSIALLW